MPEYWATFRLERNANYDDRYNSMIEALQEIREGSWADPTSFWLFNSALEIDSAIRTLSRGLDPKKDLLVVRYLDKGAARWFGHLESEALLKQHMPYAKKAG
jgi:hypothetical protein